jgi:AraC-like DNA-binding protein
MYGYFADQKRNHNGRRIYRKNGAGKSGTSGVGEIALAIGFQSSSAFTIAFTRIVGCPPTQFLLKDQEDFSLKKLRRKQYLGYRFGHRRQVTLNYGGKGLAGSLITLY